MIFKQLILSFLATVGFAIFYSSPKKSVLPTGVIGMVGWIIYFTLENYLSTGKFLAAFIASLIVSTLGEASAKIYKKPATLFIVPGLLPLVPGAGIYYTMFELVNDNTSEFLTIGLETLFIAGALALGIIVSSVFSNSMRQKDY